MAFIINPASGNRKKERIIKMIEKFCIEKGVDGRIFITEGPGHAGDLAASVSEKFDIVVAVGGDGTVNETARGLTGLETPLGIIPAGSGNGLARHLGIPVNLEKALNNLLEGYIIGIDVWQAGNNPFVMICGLGFDAMIAGKVTGMQQRGLQAYIRLVLTGFLNFQPREIEVEWEGGSYSGKPFMVNFANASQFGNNMKIAPGASITDGLLDFGIIEKLPAMRTAEFVLRMLNGTMFNFPFYRRVQAKAFLVKTQYPGMNIDGEFKSTDAVFKIEKRKEKLNVVAGNKSRI